MTLNSPESEQDFHLKIKIMRLLWHLGYYVRKNVEINEYGDRKKYTDIDVLGIKISDELDTNFVICDCKSGSNAKTYERIFFLSGVMKYFGTNRGMFIRSKMMTKNYIDFANRLGIIPLSENQISELEKSYRISALDLFGPFNSDQEKANIIFTALRQYSPEVANYLLISYWGDSPFQQIKTLISCCKKIKVLQGIGDGGISFLLLYALSELALSILRFSKTILFISSTERSDYIKSELFGGKLKHLEQNALLSGFYDFMIKEIEDRYNQKYPISLKQFVDGMIPDYLKHLIELITRICDNPTQYLECSRLFDLINYDSLLKNQDIKPDIISIQLKTEKKFLVKPLRDFFTFAERSNLTTENLSIFFNKTMSVLDT